MEWNKNNKFGTSSCKQIFLNTSFINQIVIRHEHLIILLCFNNKTVIIKYIITYGVRVRWTMRQMKCFRIIIILEYNYPVVRVAHKSWLTVARVVSWRVSAYRVVAASVRSQTLVDVCKMITLLIVRGALTYIKLKYYYNNKNNIMIKVRDIVWRRFAYHAEFLKQ